MVKSRMPVCTSTGSRRYWPDHNRHWQTGGDHKRSWSHGQRHGCSCVANRQGDSCNGRAWAQHHLADNTCSSGTQSRKTTVRGITLTPTGSPIVSIGTRAQATNVRGITLTPAGVVPLTMAATLRRRFAGSTRGYRNCHCHDWGIVAVTTVPGINLIAQGVLIPVGRRAASTVTRGVTLAATGTVAFAIGRRAATTAVFGVTLAPGTAGAPIGKRAAATVGRRCGRFPLRLRC